MPATYTIIGRIIGTKPHTTKAGKIGEIVTIETHDRYKYSVFTQWETPDTATDINATGELTQWKNDDGKTANILRECTIREVSLADVG